MSIEVRQSLLEMFFGENKHECDGHRNKLHRITNQESQTVLLDRIHGVSNVAAFEVGFCCRGSIKQPQKSKLCQHQRFLWKRSPIALEMLEQIADGKLLPISSNTDRNHRRESSNKIE
jgi:hypothetical protein